MRVIHVAAYFAPEFQYGGPPRSILGLCKALQQSGVDVQVLTTTANGSHDLGAETLAARVYEGVRVRYLPRVPPRWLWNARGLRRVLADEIARADVVHIHGLWHLPGWTAARLSRRAGAPYVVSPRGMLEPEALAIHRWRKRLAFSLIEEPNLTSAALLHATSAREAATLERHAFGPPVVMAPNGVDLDSLVSADPQATLSAFGIPKNVPLVLYLGRIHPIKRLDLLAEAMARLRARNVHLVIAGPDEEGYRRAVEPLFDRAGVPVTWTGPVDTRQKAALLAAARVLVLCSNAESFGLSVAEAMAAGVPVVVTESCGWPDVESAGTGRLVPQSPDAMAFALDEILGDRQLALAMGARGRALVASRYTWAAAASALADRYRELAAARRSMARVS